MLESYFPRCEFMTERMNQYLFIVHLCQTTVILVSSGVSLTENACFEEKDACVNKVWWIKFKLKFDEIN